MDYKMNIAGVERALPLCPLNDKLQIGAFVMFGDVELTVACAKALLETILSEMVLTGSRGGAVFLENGEEVKEDFSYRKYLTLTENGKVSFAETKPVPEMHEPFEKYLKPAIEE